MTTPATGATQAAIDAGRGTRTSGRILPASLASDSIASRVIQMPGQVTLQQMQAMYRQRQIAIGLAASRAIAALWRQHIDPAQMAGSWATIRDVILHIVQNYFDASAADSARTYEQMRVLADLPYRKAELARLPQQELERVVDSQGPGHFFQMLPDMPDEAQASSLADSSLQSSGARLALKGGRQTIVQSVHGDPLAQGWERIISGTACSFCSMLASRGAVYKSEKSADFRAHDHCSCTALPIFEGQEATQQSQDLAKQWQSVTRGKSGASARKAWQDHWENSHGGRDSGAAEEAQGQGPGNGQRLGRPQLPDQAANGIG